MKGLLTALAIAAAATTAYAGAEVAASATPLCMPGAVQQALSSPIA